MSCKSPIEKFRNKYIELTEKDQFTLEQALNKLGIMTECCKCFMIQGTRFDLNNKDLEVITGKKEPKNNTVLYDTKARYESRTLRKEDVPDQIGVPTLDERYPDKEDTIMRGKIITGVGCLYLAR